MDVSISSSTGKVITLRAPTRTLTKQERRKKAVKILGIFWGLAFFFLPLPPLHWVFTPLFFFLGPFWAFRTYQQPTYFHAFSYSCPECNVSVDFKSQAIKEQLSFSCPHCRYMLRLSSESKSDAKTKES